MGVIKKDVLLPKPDQMIVPAHHGSMFGSPDLSNVKPPRFVGAATVSHTATILGLPQFYGTPTSTAACTNTRQLPGRRSLLSVVQRGRPREPCFGTARSRIYICIFVQSTGYAYAVCIRPRHYTRQLPGRRFFSVQRGRPREPCFGAARSRIQFHATVQFTAQQLRLFASVHNHTV